VEIEYERRGAGTPLLLIGGLGSQLISWDDRFCDILVARGYSVIRYDNRDSGLSSSFDQLGVPDLLGLLLHRGRAPYLLGDMTADAIGLLDHLGVDRAHVLGLSLGGMIGQLMALRHPERVTSMVAAMSGPPGRPTAMPSPAVVEALLSPPAPDFDGKVDRAVELRRALAGEGADFDDREARRRAEAQITRAHRPAGTMRQAAAVLATPNLLDQLVEIKAPTMIVHGELDPLVPFASGVAAAAAIHGAEFVPLAGVGHDLPPAVALRLIDRISDFHRSAAISA
jgi:pimeloyl-ACP methyl ester carboxylesterase